MITLMLKSKYMYVGKALKREIESHRNVKVEQSVQNETRVTSLSCFEGIYIEALLEMGLFLRSPYGPLVRPFR